MKPTTHASPGPTERVIDLRGRMLEFIDGEVSPQERIIDDAGPAGEVAIQ
jgi:hypothetical protein